MNKPRINILTPIPFWHPGTEELISGLKNEGFNVVALDIWEFLYFDELGKTHYLVPRMFNGLFRRIYRKAFRKTIIRKYIQKDDIVDMQWCGYYYAKYLKCIKKRNDKIVATPFGSDVLRATDKERNIQKIIFESAKLIVLSINWTDQFISYFPFTENKIRNNQFGSKRYDLIMETWSEANKLEFRKKYQIKDNKIVVTVGYSANPVQQHLLFLEMLKDVDLEICKKLFLVFPLTYGINKETDYYQTLKKSIYASGIDYILFEKRMSDYELCESRIISDIMVNLQVTDTQASSIKEAFAARNIVLVGDWLPYKFYEDLGVFLIRSDLKNFKSNFIGLIEGINTYKNLTNSNLDVVSSFASWERIIPKFINVYKELNNDRNR
jgi:glycosyltransferase involved in cell wall biosynthesis